ncbi:MAG: HlyD family efflux transporter periplasmic adaptor subunit [Methylobacterium sp.]|nr:HlyD family efflux transporter periplasmic adaptor subunit [Methylobacterium sp.]MCA3650969.1 HlyD family efflux transporter periplasmic adaptor subunit [Methylobacterium sp.]MCA4922608.1 HlyD family efflux transporter periplasmic adaptor subunit [Methylobacterium sp.]
MAPNWTRALPVVAIGLALAAAGMWALWPQPVPVDVHVVTRGPMEVTVEDEGISRVRNVYTISAPLLGKVRRSQLRTGDAVIRDETIVARIEPVDPSLLDFRSLQVQEAAVEAARAAVELAAAQMRQARAQLEFARAELQRSQTLLARQAVTERAHQQALLAVDTAEAALASTSATLDLRRHEFDQAQALRLQPGEDAPGRTPCCIEIRAPESGRVLRLAVESAQVVQPGQLLLEIGDTDDLEIAVDLVSRDALRVAEGGNARIENWGGEGALAARVARIEPSGFTKVSALGIEEQRVKVVLDLLEPRDRFRRLGHGFRVIVRISVWHGEDVVSIPLGALFRHRDRWATYVVEQGRAKLHPVEIGERNLREAQVLSGLGAGQQIVLHPSDRLADGARITVRR